MCLQRARIVNQHSWACQHETEARRPAFPSLSSSTPNCDQPEISADFLLKRMLHSSVRVCG